MGFLQELVHPRRAKPGSVVQKLMLTEAQRRMYASEKLENFRWIAKLVATYSSYTLTASDLAPPDVERELTELGATLCPYCHLAETLPP